MVGIGNGVSFDMIKRGAINGGGESLFIMDNNEMEKQVIYLLEAITKFKVNNFNMEYNQKMIDCTEPLIPSSLRKGRANNFFLNFKGVMPVEELEKEVIKVSYFD